MTWNDFFKALKAGDIAPVYLFAGPEALVKRQALEALRAKLLPPGLEALNDTTLEGVTAQQITDACETMPMMCDRRIVTVRDWAPLMPGRRDGVDAEMAGEPASELRAGLLHARRDGRAQEAERRPPEAGGLCGF